MKVLVFLEAQGGQVKKSGLELLTAANAGQATVSTFSIGIGSKAVADSIRGWGVQAHFFSEDERVANYNPEFFTQIFADVLSAEKPDLVLASSSMLARDLFPRVAARTDSAFVSDCTSLKITGTQVDVRRPLYAGKCTAKVNFGKCASKIVLMRANQLPVSTPAGSDSPKAQEISIAPADIKTTVKGVTKTQTEKLDLTEANVIVSGGRGMQGPEHFTLLEKLADPMDATVGASRAVVDAGWVPHSMQVGQTGKTVAPNLYFAVGISGAIQHLAGMSGSKVIVAINKDSEAPIFQKSTYGIVGDAFEILPKLTEEISTLTKS